MNYLTDLVVEIWNDYGDPRTGQWILTKNLYLVFVLLAIFLLISHCLLPYFLRGKKYAQFTPILALYYFLVGLIGFAYILVYVYLATIVDFDFRCFPIHKDFEGIHYFIAMLVYFWVWYKVFEYFEIFLLIIVNGEAPIFIVLHHTIFPVLCVIFTHFYAGGTPTMFGMIINIGHSILYFIIGIRTLSERFRVKSESWYMKFRILESIAELVITIIYFAQVESRETCEYEVYKFSIIFLSSIFLLVSIYVRWSYICHAFGDTILIKLINKIFCVSEEREEKEKEEILKTHQLQTFSKS